MDFQILQGKIPPVGSPHWLTWKHIAAGTVCVVLAAVMLTACLSDYFDSGTPLPPAPVLNPDYAASPNPLPPPSGTQTGPTSEQLNGALYQDDEDHFSEALLDDDALVATDFVSRMGHPDENGFLHPQFDLNDWYHHVKATDLKYRWALSKYDHWLKAPLPMELRRLRVLDDYIKRGIGAFPDPRNAGFIVLADIWRWQAGLKLYKGTL
jgi:hypothetical protein